jgi:hypothetical protein
MNVSNPNLDVGTRRLRLQGEIDGAISKLSAFLKHAAPWIVIGTVVTSPVLLFVVLFILDGSGLIGDPPCLTEVRGRIPGLSGFDFEISETGCSTIAKDTAVSVLVSKTGERKKTFLFKYVPIYVGPYPTIIPIDEHTMQISLSNASSISCRRDKWGALTVKYDIGAVQHPSLNARPPEC